MGVFERLRSSLPWLGRRGAGPLEEARVLDVPSGDNFRDLGGYDTPCGLSCYRRFVRSGSTAYLSEADLSRLEAYGISRVLDLRSPFEEPYDTDRFAPREGIAWCNVPLFDYDLSDPKLTGVPVPDGNYLIDGYVTMLSNQEALRRIFEFFAETPAGEGVLFHCAAGMDRTGMVAMLLLGLADVPRSEIVADYLYSFAPIREVDEMVFRGREPKTVPGSWNPLPSRCEAVSFMLDRIEGGYGTTHAFLAACGIDGACLDAVRGMLVPTDAPAGVA